MSLNISHSILPESLAYLVRQSTAWTPSGSDKSLPRGVQTARAAKRRRIEEHAESYMRGNQLFIASAALRGPFEHGWINPWLSNREKQVGRAPAATRIPNTSARPARRQMNPVQGKLDKLKVRKLEADRRGWQVTDEQFTAQHKREPDAVRSKKTAPRPSARSRAQAAAVRDPFIEDNRGIYGGKGSDSNGNGTSSPLNPEDVTFAPDNASPYMHRWLKRLPVDNVVDPIREASPRSSFVTPTNPVSNRTRRGLRPQAHPRLEPIEQIDEQAQVDVAAEDGDEDPIISPSRSSNKKRLSGGRSMQITSPALNGSQGLQFRKGGRGWREAIAAARFLELDAVDEVSPNKRGFGSAEKRPASATKRLEVVVPLVDQDARPSADAEALDEEAGLGPALEDPGAGSVDDVQSDSGSESGSDSTESRSGSNASASTPTATSAPEPLPPTATLQPTTTVSTVPSGTTSNAPPDHQPEDYSKVPTTEIHSHPSQTSIEDDESDDDSDDDSDRDSTIMVYNSARKPDLSTQAAYHQAQEALDDIFVTPAASPEKVDETIIDILPAFDSGERAAEPIASQNQYHAPTEIQTAAGNKRKVAMLDTPELERMANEVSFSTVKRRRTQGTQAATQQPLKSLLKRSFPTPPSAAHNSPSKDHDSPCPPPTTLPVTSITPSRQDTSTTTTGSPTKNITSTIPDHQPSFDFAGDMDLDLDSCLKDAAGLLETADLETEVRGVRRSMGGDGIASQG